MYICGAPLEVLRTISVRLRTHSQYLIRVMPAKGNGDRSMCCMFYPTSRRSIAICSTTAS